MKIKSITFNSDIRDVFDNKKSGISAWKKKRSL